MPPSPRTVFEPRKKPVQARSAASVQAILDATLQVLVAHGKESLTTTRVAQRAGVSVGTLYQYFPNKSSLLQAVLRNHLDSITSAVEQVCVQHAGCPAPLMVSSLIEVFFAAKLKAPRASVALYSVSADLDGARISKAASDRAQRAIASMLATAKPALLCNLEAAAVVLQGAMAGISRNLLEGVAPERRVQSLCAEFTSFACAYLSATTKGPAETSA